MGEDKNISRVFDIKIIIYIIIFYFVLEIVKGIVFIVWYY